MPGSTGEVPGAAGSMPGTPGSPGAAGSAGSSGQSGSSGGVLAGGNAGGGSQTGGAAGRGQAGADGTFNGNDPFGGLGRAGGGVMTAAERRAVLDGQLEKSYGTFDGMIIAERQKAESQANEAGSQVMGTGGGGEGSEAEGAEGAEGTFGQPGSISVASASGGGGGNGNVPGGAAARQGEYSNTAPPTFAPPADIPSGDDDDVVARQLREAAMHEPDPVLREKLWDEYRKYTGLSQ